jgi:hypothetical protein
MTMEDVWVETVHRTTPRKTTSYITADDLPPDVKKNADDKESTHRSGQESTADRKKRPIAIQDKRKKDHSRKEQRARETKRAA